MIPSSTTAPGLCIARQPKTSPGPIAAFWADLFDGCGEDVDSVTKEGNGHLAVLMVAYTLGGMVRFGGELGYVKGALLGGGIGLGVCIIPYLLALLLYAGIRIVVGGPVLGLARLLKLDSPEWPRLFAGLAGYLPLLVQKLLAWGVVGALILGVLRVLKELLFGTHG